MEPLLIGEACVSKPSIRSRAWPEQQTDGIAKASMAAWILVLRPRVIAPNYGHPSPFCDARPSRVLMCTHNHRVDHQPFEVGFRRGRFKKLVQRAALDPAVVAGVSQPGSRQNAQADNASGHQSAPFTKAHPQSAGCHSAARVRQLARQEQALSDDPQKSDLNQTSRRAGIPTANNSSLRPRTCQRA